MRKFLAFALFVIACLAASARVVELTIPNGDGHIYGVLSQPDSGTSHGVVIVSHGFNGNHEFGKNYFSALNKLGYAVYTFDFPCGSARSRSDSNTLGMSIVDETDALKNIVRYFRSRPDIDKNRIVLLGESQGGLVSALAAAELRSEVSRLILIYPAFCIPDDWNKRYPSVSDIPDVTKIWNVPVGKRFFTELHKMDVFSTIPRYDGPVLIIHGTEDPIVAAGYSTKAFRVYSGRPLPAGREVSLVEIDKARHGFTPFETSIAISRIESFLR